MATNPSSGGGGGFHGFCCRDCGMEGYCMHKLDVASSIFSVTDDNDAIEERARQELSNLSMEERFNIYAAMVPPPPPIPPPPPMHPPKLFAHQHQNGPPSRSILSSAVVDDDGDCCFGTIHTGHDLAQVNQDHKHYGDDHPVTDDEDAMIIPTKRPPNEERPSSPPRPKIDLPYEDPQHVEECLRRLDVELETKISPKDKVAYEQAKNINMEFVTDRSFRLSLLRADQFNVKDCAKRIVTHFQIKKDLFCTCNWGGDTNRKDTDVLDISILGRDVTRDDLSPYEQTVLDEGESFRVLKEPDHSGRYVIRGRMAKMDFNHKTSQVS